MGRTADARRLAIVGDSSEAESRSTYAGAEAEAQVTCSYCYGTSMEMVSGRRRDAAATKLKTDGAAGGDSHPAPLRGVLYRPTARRRGMARSSRNTIAHPAVVPNITAALVYANLQQFSYYVATIFELITYYRENKTIV